MTVCCEALRINSALIWRRCPEASSVHICSRVTHRRAVLVQQNGSSSEKQSLASLRRLTGDKRNSLLLDSGSPVQSRKTSWPERFAFPLARCPRHNLTESLAVKQLRVLEGVWSGFEEVSRRTGVGAVADGKRFSSSSSSCSSWWPSKFAFPFGRSREAAAATGGSASSSPGGGGSSAAERRGTENDGRRTMVTTAPEEAKNSDTDLAAGSRHTTAGNGQGTCSYWGNITKGVCGVKYDDQQLQQLRQTFANLKDYDLEDLRLWMEAFDSFDHDADGYISHADLQKSPQLTLEKIRILKQYDADQNNLIDFGEFVHAMYEVDVKTLKESFDGFDPVDIQLEFDKLATIREGPGRVCAAAATISPSHVSSFFSSQSTGEESRHVGSRDGVDARK